MASTADIKIIIRRGLKDATRAIAKDSGISAMAAVREEMIERTLLGLDYKGKKLAKLSPGWIRRKAKLIRGKVRGRLESKTRYGVSAAEAWRPARFRGQLLANVKVTNIRVAVQGDDVIVTGQLSVKGELNQIKLEALQSGRYGRHSGPRRQILGLPAEGTARRRKLDQEIRRRIAATSRSTIRNLKTSQRLS